MSEQVAEQVPPQPVPTSFRTSVIPTPGGNLVVLEVFTPVGQSVVFIDPQTAQRLGGMIRAAGKQAATGLLVPPGVHLNGDES